MLNGNCLICIGCFIEGDYLENNELHKLQIVLFEMLQLIDKICREYDIKYSLFGGTLLGAIRHKGFIPWDDDIDIAMRRDQYDKFISVWNKINPKGYFLQNKDNTPSYTQSFAKIRKDNTAFIQFEWEKGLYHTGIFIDIFPIDRVPNGKVNQAAFFLKGIKYIILLRDNHVIIKNKLFSCLVKIVYLFSSKRSRKDYFQNYRKYVNKYNSDSHLKHISIESFDMLKKHFSNTLCDEYDYLEFESKKFMCFKNWENYLTTMYGDYMSLPPVEDRVWKHHPLVLSFEHSFDEIGKQES